VSYFHEDPPPAPAALQVFWIVLLYLFLYCAAAAVPRAAQTIEHADTFQISELRLDSGMVVLTLRCPEHGAFTVMGDQDLPIAKWIIAHKSQRVRLRLEVVP
jgi:hypothetical protein